MLSVRKVPATIAAFILASIVLGLWIERETVIGGLHLRPVLIPDENGNVVSLGDPIPTTIASTTTKIDKPTSVAPAVVTVTATASATSTAPVFGQITDRVAAITDTQFTAGLIPLLLHYHAVLGPTWPIVFFTTQKLIDEHLVAKSKDQKISGSWRKALEDKRIEVRRMPESFNMSSREGVNKYLADKWMWEQLAPAKHVLVFQTDAVLCANSPFVIDDYLQYDFIGAAIPPLNSMLYNGGLSLRNRTMIMEILNEGNVWKPHIEGEDVWFSKHMGKRKANLPLEDIARNFALQYPWNFNDKGRPFGYHKIQKNVPDRMEGIAQWCPEIALTQTGKLEQ